MKYILVANCTLSQEEITEYLKEHNQYRSWEDVPLKHKYYYFMDMYGDSFNEDLCYWNGICVDDDFDFEDELSNFDLRTPALNALGKELLNKSCAKENV